MVKSWVVVAGVVGILEASSNLLDPFKEALCIFVELVQTLGIV